MSKKSAIQRIEDLEARVDSLQMTVTASAAASEEVTTGLTKAVKVLDRVFAALHEALPDDLKKAFVEKMEEIHRRDQEDQVETEKAWVKDMLEIELLKELEVVEGDNLMLQGHEKSSGGEEIFPGWVLAPLENFETSVREALEGARVGAEVKTPNGNIFVLENIYQLDTSNK